MRKTIIFFLCFFLLFSCGKKKVDPVQEKEKQELQQLLNEKPMSESEIINEKLERLIRFSRENVETREELEKKINMEMSDFTEATRQKFYNFVDKDGAFSKNPRNVDTVIEIQNIEWDVTEDIRVVNFTEKLFENGKLEIKQEVQMAFKVISNNGDITVEDFAFQIQK